MPLHPIDGRIGLNLNNTIRGVPDGQYSFALNAILSNFDGNKYTLQNEQANEECESIPEGFVVIGRKNIIERGLIFLLLTNPTTGESEIGKIVDCVYSKIINADCLNFDIDHPIHKMEYRLNGEEIEIYFTDYYNNRRWINLSALPYRTIVNGCEIEQTEEIDCNKLNVQPNFSIPQLTITDVDSDGTLKAGTLQFAIQYAASNSEPYTAYYSVTNPLSLFDPNKITQDFNYDVNKSVQILVENIDVTGFYDYINLAVIKTINNISSAELVGTYRITEQTKTVIYTGQRIKELAIDEIFLKYPIYKKADDVTSVQDVLVWVKLTKQQRISYQQIANQITLDWQTWRVPDDKPYSEEENQVYLKSAMRDEIVPYEIVFLLTNGHQTDGFHIPGRTYNDEDVEIVSNNDALVNEPEKCDYIPQSLPKWQVYNTGCLTGYEPLYTDFVTNPSTTCVKCPPVINLSSPECYTGPYQYGCMSYWQSTETYPCDEDVWGSLSGLPIRHHKFPDCNITHIHDNEGFIYPIGIRLDTEQIKTLILNSSLTQEQKDDVVGFKIVRGNRANNKSVVAKGLIYNVGKYIKDEQTFFYPNYPYNDLREDPFINTDGNYVLSTPEPTAGIECLEYRISTYSGVVDYVGCNGDVQSVTVVGTLTVCSSVYPTFSTGAGTIITGAGCGAVTEGSDEIIMSEGRLKGFETNDSRERYTLHSPDTHFYQPSLGNLLKLETAEFGLTKSHFVETKNHAKYRFISDESVALAFVVGAGVGFFSSEVGVVVKAFDGTAAWTAFQTILDIIYKLLPKKNFAYHYSSVGEYTDYNIVENTGNKQRFITLSQYLIPGKQNAGDDFDINNYQRESSVFLRTYNTLPFPHTIAGVPEDNSRYTLSNEGLCDTPTTILNKPISAYYASIKNNIPNQYGQIYSYETVDTGFQWLFSTTTDQYTRYQGVFGGDTFINRFGLKRKFPFFLDNRINPEGTTTFPDEADVFYNELGNIGFPRYWFSTDIRKSGAGLITGLFGVKDTAFDCKEGKFFYDAGKIYLFAYGLPYFYCESQVNVDLRQAYNSKEGDFYPHVSSSIPDDWMQETNVTIQHDNTYYYNKTYSKQNKENFFSHYPEDYDPNDELLTHSAVFSEQQKSNIKNNWLIYRPISIFDFPQNYGALTGINGIENKQLLVTFENKSLVYNALLTAPTSAGSVYLGSSLFSQNVPPLDFADTELGYAGSQHKFFYKTEYGHPLIDSLRGQIFLIQGNKEREITDDRVSNFFVEHLPFKILKSFPDYNIDNAFKDIGLHGVFDNKYNRLIITKLDYEPLFQDITLNNGQFFKGGALISISDPTYFANRSFTVSYNFPTQSWASFHTYTPNYYIGDNNKFYSNDAEGLWSHNTQFTKFNNFYGEIHPYTIEYCKAYQAKDEILQSIKDYTQVLQYTDEETFVQTDNIYFNEAVIYNNHQCSGVRKLTKKPTNNLKLYSTFPKYNSDSIEILYTKSDNFYNFNTFWSCLKDNRQPIFVKSVTGFHKELNQPNMDYSKRSRQKAPIRSKDTRIRLNLNDTDQYHLISQFVIEETQISFK